MWPGSPRHLMLLQGYPAIDEFELEAASSTLFSLSSSNLGPAPTAESRPNLSLTTLHLAHPTLTTADVPRSHDA